jgi:hypothetical protein
MLTDVRKIASIVRSANKLSKAYTKNKIQYIYTTNNLVVSEYKILDYLAKDLLVDAIPY